MGNEAKRELLHFVLWRCFSGLLLRGNEKEKEKERRGKRKGNGVSRKKKERDREREAFPTAFLERDKAMR